MRAYHQLSTAEQASLWRRKEAGDTAARETLLAANYPLVGRMAKNFVYSLTDYDDLFQAGILGLVSALEQFDPHRGVAFATYAVPFIKGELCRCLEDRRGAKHGGEHQRIQRSCREAERQLCQELQRLPTLQELADQLGMTPENLLLYVEQEEILFVADAALLAAEEDGYDRVEDKLFTETLVASLTEREREIIVRHYWRRHTQQEIAVDLGISQAQVSRLLCKAIAKMRNRAKGEEPNE